jgi:large subunit ribosomal protein L10
MAKTRARKEAEVQQVVDGLRGAKSVVFADLSALKVNDATAFRGNAKNDDIEVFSSKKTLLRIALKEAGLEGIDVAQLQGSVSMLFGKGDEVAPAKALEAFRKDHENIKVLGGILESKWMTADEVKALAKLPSKDQLIAQVVGTIRAPLSGLVGALQGNLRNLVYVLNAIKESKSA